MTLAEEKAAFPHWFSHDEPDPRVKVVRKVFKNRKLTTFDETIEHVQTHVKEHLHSSKIIKKYINELNAPKSIN